jgi:CheY-like chemotaxis protein
MKRVLVVDDEFGLLEALGEVLAEAGYAVSIARNGSDALKRVAETRPDLVLCDYMMPVMDGPRFVRALRADPQTAKLPVVMMTAVKLKNLPEGLELSGTLQKPFSIDVLLAQVKQLIG